MSGIRELVAYPDMERPRPDALLITSTRMLLAFALCACTQAHAEPVTASADAKSAAGPAAAAKPAVARTAPAAAPPAVPVVAPAAAAKRAGPGAVPL